MIQPAGAMNDSPTTIPVGEGLSEAETLPDHMERDSAHPEKRVYERANFVSSFARPNLTSHDTLPCPGGFAPQGLPLVATLKASGIGIFIGSHNLA